VTTVAAVTTAHKRCGRRMAVAARCGGRGGRRHGRAARLQRREKAWRSGSTEAWWRGKLGQGGGSDGLKRVKKKIDLDEQLKEHISAFHAVTERAGRLTGHGGAASGQSPVSSWRDWTRTESGQRSLGNSLRMTGRGCKVQIG
jgi:hypothetical protein